MFKFSSATMKLTKALTFGMASTSSQYAAYRAMPCVLMSNRNDPSRFLRQRHRAEGLHSQKAVGPRLPGQNQVTKVYARNGMVFPVSCSSTLLHLNKNGPASVTEVARALPPHQTVAQLLATLSKLHVIEKRTDAADRRRTEYFLTEFGTAQASLGRLGRLKSIFPAARKVASRSIADLSDCLGQSSS